MLPRTPALPCAASAGPSVDYVEVRYMDSLHCSGFKKFDIELCKVEEMFGRETPNWFDLPGPEEGDLAEASANKGD